MTRRLACSVVEYPGPFQKLLLFGTRFKKLCPTLLHGLRSGTKYSPPLDAQMWIWRTVGELFKGTKFSRRKFVSTMTNGSRVKRRVLQNNFLSRTACKFYTFCICVIWLMKIVFDVVYKFTFVADLVKEIVNLVCGKFRCVRQFFRHGLLGFS